MKFKMGLNACDGRKMIYAIFFGIILIKLKASLNLKRIKT
jgi:hypothetical protein